MHFLYPFQIGAYFGSEISSVDVDGNGITDILLVGAPMYFSEGRERGKVYTYSLKEVILALVSTNEHFPQEKHIYICHLCHMTADHATDQADAVSFW